MKCKYCGYNMESGAKYCEECGAAVEKIDLFKQGQNDMPDVSQQSYENQQYQQNTYEQPNYGYQQEVSGYRQFGQTQPFGGMPANTPYNMTSASPRYVGFKEAVRLFFKNYANFEGRSTCSEYWYVTLFFSLIAVGLCFLTAALAIVLDNDAFDISVGALALAAIAGGWAMLVPSLSLAVRRMHDSGRSGLLLLLGLIPYAGAIITLVFMCSPSGPANKYGPAPNPDPNYDPNNNNINML
ncbi:MAG: DUF805 domain-containing protein [Ruminococcus sp.]|nr:DUF805 domain-containing protein [Ruminococcus sp.]